MPATPPPPSRLFRPEAVEHANSSGYGQLINAQPVSFRVLVVAVLLAIALILAFVLTCSYTRKATLEGVLMPQGGITAAVSDAPGTVRALDVTEGSLVARGDTLAVVSAERRGEGREDSTRVIETLLNARKQGADAGLANQLAQAAHRIEFSKARLTALGQERQQIASQIAIEAQRVELAEEAVRRAEALLTAQFLSAAGVQERSASLLEARSRLAELRRLDATRGQEEIQVRAEIADLEDRRAREHQQAAGAVKALEQEIAQHRLDRVWSVVAEQGGRVAGITVRPGDAIQPGRTLLTIVPVGVPLEAIVYVSASDIGFVRDGMPVMLRWTASGADRSRQLIGHVKAISAAAMRRADMPEFASARSGPGGDDRGYRLRIALDQASLDTAETEGLRPGMSLTAHLQLEKHRLLTWLLAPFERLARPLA